MNSRVLPIAGIGTIALIAAASFSGAASASSSGATPLGVVHSSATHAGAQTPKSKTCYSGNSGDSGTGIVSINTDDSSGWTSAGAVDFRVRRKCTITEVDATGVYAAGSGPADSVVVTFYKARKGLPGKVVHKQTVKGDFASPVYNLAIKRVKLTKGTYFVSVVANMTFSEVGGWFWEISTTQQGRFDSAFENTGGAFGFCPTWTALQSCYGYSGDYMVSLSN